MATFRKLAFGYSTRCNIRCEHCIAADDDGTTQQMDLVRAVAVIEELADCNVKGISFTAGEPLIFMDDILALLQVCRQRDIYARVVTNGFWATTPERSDRTVSQLKQNGLSQLRISFSRWHEKFVHRENIVNASASCRKSGLDYFISFITDFSEEDDEREQFLRENRLRFFPEPVIYFGRAGSFDRPDIHTDYQPNTCRMNPYLSPELDFYACCDAGNRFDNTDLFRLGNVGDTSLEGLFGEFENNIFLNLIRHMGLTDIASYLGFRSRDIITYRKCELCEKLFNSRATLTLLEQEINRGLLEWKR